MPKSSTPEATPTTSSAESLTRQVAVIDVGSTSMRMAVAEISSDGNVHILSTLSQAVNLGKDTFTKDRISKSTTEECVRVLKSYRQILTEFGITDSKNIRVVATSAVREASNRLSFLDRIYVSTGIDIEILEEAEVNRVTYLGIQPFLKSDPSLRKSETLIVEVGGGSTELLLTQGSDVVYSHTFRLGTLRLREMLETYRAPAAKTRSIMERQIARTVGQFAQQLPHQGPEQLVALGGDIRFAAAHFDPQWNKKKLPRIPVDALEKYCEEILQLTPDELVYRHHLTPPDAESIGPALLAYIHMARTFGVTDLLVSDVNLRDGLLKEMVAEENWSEELRRQIIRSAVALGRKFEFNEGHGQTVAKLCSILFHEIQEEHQLDARYELFLHIAALLHEIGLFIGIGSHHKHSMYIIINSEIFGLSKRDLTLIALVARYHRRATPKPNHERYTNLDRDQRIAVTKMSAILRVADALDRSLSQRISDIECEQTNGKLIITASKVKDVSLEQLALKQKGALFEDTFGLQVQLRPG